MKMEVIESLYQLFTQSTGICTDTRKLQPGNLFLAFKGPNFNGNQFAAQAINAGALAAVVDENIETPNENIYRVDNVLACLQKLANHHRKKLNIPIVAIGGSNGKTTTKELTAAVLSTQYNTFSTPGNLNNHIGVPLCLLMMNTHTQIAVLEMGANHVGELADLCRIAEPDYGLITNHGLDHLEGYGSIEGVMKGNCELYEWLKAIKGTAFVNANDFQLMQQSAYISKRILYGSDDSPTYATIAENQFYLKVYTHFGQTWQTQLAGDYNLPNINAALSVGIHFGISDQNCKLAIESYKPANNRSQWIQKGDFTVLVDCYNANPSSMELALRNFAQLQMGNKVAFLGDMFELGMYSAKEHKNIVELAVNSGFFKCIFCGNEFYASKPANSLNNAHFFETRTQAEQWIKNNLSVFRPSTWLIKGSRGMQMEKFLEIID